LRDVYLADDASDSGYNVYDTITVEPDLGWTLELKRNRTITGYGDLNTQIPQPLGTQVCILLLVRRSFGRRIIIGFVVCIVVRCMFMLRMVLVWVGLTIVD
jgi:hypothetical protein